MPSILVTSQICVAAVTKIIFTGDEDVVPYRMYKEGLKWGGYNKLSLDMFLPALFYNLPHPDVVKDSVEISLFENTVNNLRTIVRYNMEAQGSKFDFNLFQIEITCAKIPNNSLLLADKLSFISSGDLPSSVFALGETCSWLQSSDEQIQTILMNFYSAKD